MKKVAFAVALALGMVSNPALADGSEKRAFATYSDLDLTKAAGRATFDRRLKNAINKVCQSDWSRSVRVNSEARKCKAKLREKTTPMRDAIIAKAQARASRNTLAANPR
ncbi:MAG: UrcA family protein [Pseudomonadota bacterium]